MRNSRIIQAEIERRQKQTQTAIPIRNQPYVFHVSPIINANEKIILDEYVKAHESVVISASPDKE